MADLKTGTTIGGTLVWTQGNFPLYPTGDTLLYKNFMIYSENNKPQAADNDFVSKRSGGLYLSTVEYQKGIAIRGGNNKDTLQAISFYGPYSGGEPSHGMFMAASSDVDGFGKHGSMTGSWGIYNRLGTAGGWVYRYGATNIASISTTGVITADNQVVSLSESPTAPQHLTRKDYVDGLINTTTANANSRVLRSGDKMTGVLTAPNFISINLATGPDHVPKLSQVVQKNTTLDYGTF